MNSTKPARTSAGCAVVLAGSLASMAAWSLEPASPATAAAVKRDSSRCLLQTDVDACNDAIRRHPSDPALLVALADGLMRAKRPADAIRHYRRAEALAPHMPGVAAKLVAAEKRLAADRASIPVRRAVQSTPRVAADPEVARDAPHIASGRQYTNAAPETQSH